MQRLVSWLSLRVRLLVDDGTAEGWRKAEGVEPTRKRLTPPPGFEAQPHHRVRVPSSDRRRGARRCGFLRVLAE